MENQIQQLLDNVYELEGLLHMSQKRDDLKEDFLRLVGRKGKEISRLCEELMGKDENDDSEINENFKEGKEDFASSFEYSIEDDSMPSQTTSDEEFHNPTSQDSAENFNNEESRGQLVFSINDKYRFRKELFSNSDVEFNNTLALVASMDSYEEAENYFLNELGWNSGNPAIMDFFQKLKKYFNE